MPTNRVQNDFAIQYFDITGKLLRTDVLGVSVFNQYPSGNDVLYGNSCMQSSQYCQVILDGQVLGYPSLPTDAMQTYSIEYMSLLRKYFPPRPLATANALIIGYEVYSTARNADVTFDLTNMDLVGNEMVP